MKQHTEAVNMLRPHFYEFGDVALEGNGYIPCLAKVVDDPHTDTPELARDIGRMLLEQMAGPTGRINSLKARIAALSNEADMPRRLQMMPGDSPVSVLAIETFALPMEQLRLRRDFAAWLGLVPLQKSKGNRQKQGSRTRLHVPTIRINLQTEQHPQTISEHHQKPPMRRAKMYHPPDAAEPAAEQDARQTRVWHRLTLGAQQCDLEKGRMEDDGSHFCEERAELC